MRFISAQLDALLTDDLWLVNARHANAMADRLATALEEIDGISPAHPVQANGVFLNMAPDLIAALEYDADGNHAFHIWDSRAGVVRLMCSWDTTPTDVDAFADRARAAADRAFSQRA